VTTVIRSIRFATKGRRKRAVVATTPTGDRKATDSCRTEPAAPDATVGRVPRVARLMALAIRFDQLLRDGVVANQTELARLARVTQPRMTQLMNLCHLAPDIQEEILFLPLMMRGRDPIHEHMLRGVTACAGWREQRAKWAHVNPPVSRDFARAVDRETNIQSHVGSAANDL